jgi:lactate 2-monooxygenase
VVSTLLVSDIPHVKTLDLSFVRLDSNELTLSLLKRAKDADCSVLVVTLDTMSVGWRPHDLDTAYIPFIHSYGCQNAFADPVFMARYGKQPETRSDLAFPYNPHEINTRIMQGDPVAKATVNMSKGWAMELSSGRQRSWSELKLLRENWDGPLVLKGIQCAADAELAIDAGADGIVVSNHGGRQVDGGVSALWSLEQIMKSKRVKEVQAAGKFTVLFDSSIRSGPDLFKALALGAQAILCKLHSLSGSLSEAPRLTTFNLFFDSGAAVRIWVGSRRS